MDKFNRAQTDISPAMKIQAQVRELIPDFQKFCLATDYDVVVPLESEGFSILWPQLRRDHVGKPQIIPSSVIKRAKPEDLNGKKVLIADASTYSGQTILEIQRQIKDFFPFAKVDLASMVVYKGLTEGPNFVYPNLLLLSQNQYDWARESIAEYISSNVFMHYGDPPLWGFRYSVNDGDWLYEALEKSGTFYSLPNYCDDCGEWNRFSIDNVQLEDRGWLPSSIEPEGFIKIRLFVHKTNPAILILPLFFPIVPLDIELNLTEILSSLRQYFPPEFDAILKFAEEVPHDPYLYMRWISTIGSMLLLRDFYRKLTISGALLKPDEPFLQGPIPNLRNYSCRTEVLLAFERVMTALLSDNNSHQDLQNQAPLLNNVFTFDVASEHNQYKEPLNPALTLVPTEQYLGAIIGHESIKVADEIRKTGGSTDLPVLCEFTFPELRSAAHELTLIGVNRALDVLVDESIVNLCFKEDENNRIHRGYYIGGESKRRILETLGYAFEDIIAG